MKHLLTFAVLFAGLTAHADYSCQTHPELGKATVGLSLSNGVYEVAVWGASRNTSEATYQGSSHVTRFGILTRLTKLSDSSTWNDMPDTLTLEHGTAATFLRLIGLGRNDVDFTTASDCSHE